MSYRARGGSNYNTRSKRSFKSGNLSRKKSNREQLNALMAEYAKKTGMQETYGDPISVYTAKQAVEDGQLFNLHDVKRSFVNYATSNLMALGYKNPDGSVNVPNVLDLIAQGLHILGDQKRGEPLYDYYKRLGEVGFASGKIELPSGDKQKVFLVKNEDPKYGDYTYTIMLPEDY